VSATNGPSGSPGIKEGIKDIDFVAKIRRQGRLIMPKNIRELLEIETGDVVKLRVMEIQRKEYPLRR